jgi:hypothetical protein
MIRENLKAAQSRQKSYADPRRREVILEVGDYAYLRVSPIRGLRRFNARGKLSPQFIGVVWTSLGPLPRWVPGPTTRWASGTTRLALHGTRRRGAQGLHRSSTRLGSCTCSTLYGGLLDVLD